MALQVIHPIRYSNCEYLLPSSSSKTSKGSNVASGYSCNIKRSVQNTSLTKTFLDRFSLDFIPTMCNPFYCTKYIHRCSITLINFSKHADNSILRYLILNACIMPRSSGCNTLVVFAGKKIIFM